MTLTQLATPTPVRPRTRARSPTSCPVTSTRSISGLGRVPPEDQQQAALNLVAKLTHLYRPMPVRIDVDTSSAMAD